MAVRLDTLFVAIRSDTTDFDRGIKGVGRELDKLGKLIEGHPTIAAGAFASSLLLVGASATKMASEVNAGIKQATASMPILQQHVVELRKDIRDLSTETGLSQVAISQAFATAAVTGVKSFTELQDVVRTAVQISEATGEDLTGIIHGLDLALDGFNLSAADTAVVGAKLYAVSQGKFGFTQLTDAIQPIVPLIKTTNIGFDTLIGALGRLLDEGASPKQAAKQLKLMAEGGEAGAAKMRDLAGQSISASEAMERLNKAAATSREDAGRLSEIIHANLNAALIDLGNKILPVVIAEMKGLVGLFDLLGGNRTIQQDTAGRTIETISRALDKLSPEVRARELKRMREAIDEVTGTKGLGSALPDFDRWLIALKGHVEDMPTENLQRLFVGLSTLANDPSLDPKKFAKLAESISLVRGALAGRGAGVLPPSAKGGSGTGGGTGTGTGNNNGWVDPDAEAAAKAAARRSAEALAELREQAHLAIASIASEFDAGFEKLLLDLDKKVRDAAATGKLAADEARQLRDQIADAFQQKAFRDEQRQAYAEGRKQAEEQFDRSKQYQAYLADQKKQFDEAAHERITSDFDATIGGIKKAIAAEREHYLQTVAISRAWEDVGAGVVGVLGAVGALDQKTADTVQNAIHLAGSFKEFVQEFQRLGEKDALGKSLSSPLAVLQTALPVLGGLQSVLGGVFGESPEQKAERERRAENTAALKAMTQAFNDYTKSLGTGAEVEKFRNLEGKLPTPTLKSRTLGFTDDELAQFGLTMDEVRDAAQKAGIALDGDKVTFGDLVNISKAFQATEFNTFATTFASQLDKLQKGFRLFGTSDGDQFSQIVDLLTDPEKGAPAIFSALDGIDIGTTEGAAKAKEILQGIFSNFESFDIADFGGLTPEEFFATIDQLFGYLPQAAKASAEEVAALQDSLKLRNLKATSGADSPEYQAAVRAQEHAAEIADAIARGFDDEAIAAIKATQALEDETAAKDAATQAAKEAADQAKRQADANEALIVRQLRAQGLDQEADDVQRAHDQLQEILDATAAGFDDATIAAIRYTQELENQAAQQRANAAAAEEAQREAERQAAEAQRAADQAEADRIARGDSALRILREEFSLFDVTDVVDQIQELSSVLQAGGPVFRQLLGGLDLTDPNARADALTRLQQFAVDNPLGVDSGTFGAATVRQATLDLAELLKQSNAVDVTQGQTGSFAINRSITEASADRMSGLIATSNIILGGIAGDVSAIARALGVPSLPPLTPPSIPFTGSPGSPAVGTASINIGTIAISMDGQVITGSPSPLVTDLIRQLSRALAADAARAAMGA